MFDLFKHELEALTKDFKQITKVSRVNPNIRLTRAERRLMERKRK